MYCILYCIAKNYNAVIHMMLMIFCICVHCDFVHKKCKKLLLIYTQKRTNHKRVCVPVIYIACLLVAVRMPREKGKHVKWTRIVAGRMSPVVYGEIRGSRMPLAL